MSGRRVLVARLDNVGDVLLAGPAVRAVAASGAEVTFLAGPSGVAAARMLPGVGEVMSWTAPWVPDPAPPVVPAAVDALVDSLRERAFDEALVLTSFHQSPLPLALLLRMAGVGRVAATSVDYPGSLLDARVGYDDGLHEVEQQLAVAAALGHRLASGDDGRLAVHRQAAPAVAPTGAYVVVHPGATVPARALPVDLAIGSVRALVDQGRTIVLTGSAADRELTASLAAAEPGAIDLAGTTDLAGLTEIIGAADALVVGNTGPAHIAAAVATPVVSVFAPTVAPHRWLPWRVPHRVLGRLDIACAGCRARRCPFEGQPCVGALTPHMVTAAVDALTSSARPSAELTATSAGRP